MRTTLTAIFACSVLAAAGCGADEGSPAAATTETEESVLEVRRPTIEVAERPEPAPPAPKGAPPRQLLVKDSIEGTGEEAETGDELTVEYIGARYGDKPFTNSWERPGRPLVFLLGGDSPDVNPGWHKGLVGMRVGGRRELIVPPRLLFYDGARPGSSPDDAVIYVVELLGVD